MLYANASLRRKEPEYKVSRCVIEKVVVLDDEDFNHFKGNLLSDYDFIRDNLDLMYMENNGDSHCLLVMGQNSDDGILVESEGYSYARYSAHLSSAKLYLTSNMEEAVALDFSASPDKNDVPEMGQKM